MNKNRYTMLTCAGLSAALLVLFSCTFLESLKEKEVVRETVFSHKAHVVENDMECTDCHAGAVAKDRASMPEISICTGCHEEPEKGSKIAVALEKLANREKTGRPMWQMMHKGGELLFSHNTHAGIEDLKAGKKKTACASCHGDVGASTTLSKAMVSRMKSCMACHEKGSPAKAAPADAKPAAKEAKDGDEGKADKAEAPKGKTGADMTACSFCHSEWRRDVKPGSHKQMWRVTHGEEIKFGISKESAYYCKACHEEDLCVRCHLVEKPRSHTEFFRTRGHGIEAEINRERCTTCHRQDFCIHCHADTRPRSHTASWGPAPYRHCNQCHTSMTGISCGVCHKMSAAGAAAGHMAIAPAYPKDLTHAGNCTMECHTGRHPDPGPTCKTCHK